MKVENTDLCPCCSGKSYAECCLPIMEGEKKAETAEQLMRARYSAYVTEHIEFLRDSSVKAVKEEFNAEMTTRWSRSARWHRLEIVATEKGGPKDKTGVVEFRAEYTAGEEFCNHHEKATFVKEKDGWKFEDGVFVSETPIVRETPKVGRNDLCPCGSGKKYKKCCGKA